MLLSASALALAGDTAKASAIADEVGKLFPLHTLLIRFSCRLSGHKLKSNVATLLELSSCCGGIPV